MKTTANTLRTLVIDNSLTMGRLGKDSIGADDYKELTGLYRNALDALTEWASADYKHTSTIEDSTAAFDAVKAVLALFATDEDRIIIDQTSMRTMRDMAIKPFRDYSKEYKDARSANKKAQKTLAERAADLVTLGAPARKEEESTEDYIARVVASGIDTKAGEVDMLELYKNADAIAIVKAKAEQAVKDAGNWTWRRPRPVSLTVFADLVENYIADCLVDGFNLKSSKTIRKEQADAKAEAKANK